MSRSDRAALGDPIVVELPEPGIATLLLTGTAGLVALARRPSPDRSRRRRLRG